MHKATSYAGNVGSTIEYEEEHRYALTPSTASHVGLTSTTVRITGAPQSAYTTEYSHDAQGRLSTMTYPQTVGESHPRFDYAYASSSGYLDTVALYQSGNSYPRYDLGSVDALGRETLARLGDTALDVQTGYDRVSLLVREIRSGTPSLGTGVQDLRESPF